MIENKQFVCKNQNYLKNKLNLKTKKMKVSGRRLRVKDRGRIKIVRGKDRGEIKNFARYQSCTTNVKKIARQHMLSGKRRNAVKQTNRTK
jgi:hypothetical protein